MSLLAKTEFGVPRTVARVSNPKNEWMFDESWGVDVAVSIPRLMTALIEEAVSVGDLVRIFAFQQGQRLHGRDHPARGAPSPANRVGDIAWPTDTVLVAIIRDERPIAPTPDDAMEAGDELLFITTARAGAAAPGARRPARPAQRRRDRPLSLRGRPRCPPIVTVRQARGRVDRRVPTQEDGTHRP